MPMSWQEGKATLEFTERNSMFVLVLTWAKFLLLYCVHVQLGEALAELGGEGGQ